MHVFPLAGLMRRVRAGPLLAALTVALGPVTPAGTGTEPGAARAITVGLPVNPPRIMPDGQGGAIGFFPEIVRRLAERLDWQPRFVPCAMADCIRMVRRGEIDMLPDVARFPERERLLRFGGEAVLQSWSYIVAPARRARGIGRIEDLDGLHVAVPADSAEARELRYLAESRSLAITLVERVSLAGVMAAVADGSADAGIVNSYFADANATTHDLSVAPVMVQPTALYFAFSPGVEARLIHRVDTALALLKADPGSAYYAAIDRWLRPQPMIDARRWLAWTVGIAAVLLALSLGINAHLRRMVARRTAALRDSQNRLKAIFDNAPVEIYLKDAEGRYLEVNRQFERLFEVRSDAIRGKLPGEVHGPTLGIRTRAHDLRILETGAPYVREEEAETRDGTRILHTVKFPIFDAEGRVDGVGAVVSDVTEQRAAQARARAFERRLADAVDALPAGFVLFDPEDRLVLCNARFRELYARCGAAIEPGMSYEDMLRRGLSSGQHPEAAGREEAWIAERMALHARSDCSFEQQLPDERWLRVVERRTEDGSTVGFRIDISDLKAHERALEIARRQAEETAERLSEQSAKLAQVVEISRVGGWDLDLETGVLYWDAIAREIHGVGRDFAPDLRAAIGLLKPSGRPAMEAAVRDCIERLAPFDLELELSGATGRVRWIRATGQPIVEQGRAVRLTGAFSDITAQKTHEKALEEARLEAEKANIAKSQFLANMSHEIRTPMNGVTGMLALMLHSDLNERQRKQAQTAYDSAAGLMRVLNDILDYSKLEANAMSLDAVPFAPRAVIEEVIAMLAIQAEEKGLSFAARIDPAMPETLIGDPARLRQILVNLAGNAIKFTEQGSVQIGARLDGRSGGWLRFTVIDTGPGIAPEAQRRLFTRFAQADAGVARRHGGTGLGLAISRQLVEAFGGQIGVISRPGEGSRFWFTIPAERAERTEPAQRLGPVLSRGTG